MQLLQAWLAWPLHIGLKGLTHKYWYTKLPPIPAVWALVVVVGWSAFVFETRVLFYRPG